MATKTILVTSGTTWTVPSDWSSTNTITCIAPGANGAAGVGNVCCLIQGGQGGGGGAAAQISKLATLTPNGTVTIQIGAANSGSPTYFNGANLGGSSVGAQAATANSTQQGLASASIGTTKKDGGAGGATNNQAAPATGSSGGGAGGAIGAGVAGSVGLNAVAGAAGPAGGAGDGGSGGAGGIGGTSGGGTGGTGGAGTEFTITAGGQAGSGGGGGAGGCNGGINIGAGGAGGVYGAGGGGGAASTLSGAAGGAGTAGCIIISYTLFQPRAAGEWDSGIGRMIADANRPNMVPYY